MSDVMEGLLARLAQLEAAQAVRNLISEYMHLCDRLDDAQTVDALVALFTEDCVWEGIGPLYANTLGRCAGRAALAAMMAGYVRQPAHFATNVHFLCSEQITVHSATRASGRWKMLQTSTFSAGGSHLNSAELAIQFACRHGRWLIHHFATCNLFSRPVDYWHSTQALPVPDNTMLPER
ncbi:nuclear transport factor 2 family protein [Enterobacteriaceae bacterium 4M9]|nr:nuclear transport factor 2 family protein [Enterobacteriaceae bacterium 4M9]